MGLLVQLPIDLPESDRPIGLTVRADWKPTPLQAKFLDIIRRTSEIKNMKSSLNNKFK